MARKRGRRSKPFKVDLKKETINSILAIVIISLGGLISVSFSRQGPILTHVFQFGSSFLGWTYILLPFIFISGGLLLTKVKWTIAHANVFLGSLIVLVSLTGLTQSGDIGQQLFLTISSLITVPGTIIFYLAGATIGSIIFFETSIEDIVIFFQTFFHKINKIFKKVFRRSDNNSNFQTSNKEMKVKGLSEELPPLTPAIPQKSFSPFNLKINAKSTNDPNEKKTDVVTGNSGKTNINWQLPPLSLLSNEKRGKAERGDLNKNAKTIEDKLKSFGIEAKVVEVNCGPAVTQYALEIALGTKLSKINALQSDLALALAAPQGQIRIEAPIPGRNLVGIEVPNRSLEFVSLKQILNAEVMSKNESKVAVALGLDVSGEPAVVDIAKMPHILIAGSTGSGKSVCLNAFIASILFRASPDEVKFIMVDPKRVELVGYNGIPHLLTPVIVDPEKVISALKWALNEMEKRYKLFAEVGVRNIAGYNSLSGFQAMPYIIILIDELADIMLFAPNEVEETITRLAQMARAVGIHLVLATQRPSVDVLTGLIKANIPCRIAFNVTSMVDSRVIIDTPGAEKLLGRGDMLYIPPDQAKPKRIQGAFVDDLEINSLIKYLQSRVEEPQYEDSVTTAYTYGRKGKSSFAGSENLGEIDDQFEESIRICVESGKASASLLQRRLSIGYARAARILDQLERAGVISAPDGSKPREVLIDSLESFLNRST